eukprot:7335262-Prymnesium_polylepis.1
MTQAAAAVVAAVASEAAAAVGDVPAQLEQVDTLPDDYDGVLPAMRENLDRLRRQLQEAEREAERQVGGARAERRNGRCPAPPPSLARLRPRPVGISLAGGRAPHPRRSPSTH